MDDGFLERKGKNTEKRTLRRYKTVGMITAGIAVLIAVLVITHALLVDGTQRSSSRIIRLKNMFSFVFLGQKPVFYFLDLEMNGKDYRLSLQDVFDVTYRDEFVIRSVSTDAIGARGVSVDIEGIGGPDDAGITLRGVELVDRVLSTTSVIQSGPIIAGSINVSYRGELIAAIPVRVTITPQDLLRHARDSGSVQNQIDYLKKASEMNRADIGVRKMLAAVYTRSGALEKAIAQYNEILSVKPDDVTVLAELLKCYIDARKYDKALKTGIKLSTLNPQDASAFAGVALAYAGKGAWDKAIVNYRESLRLNPDDSMVRFKLGEAHERMRDVRTAIEQYKLVLAREPQSEHVMMALAGAYLKMNGFDEAIRLYKEMIRRHPRNASLYANLGVAYGGKGMLAEEIESYQKALSLNGKDPVIHFNLAMAYEKGNRLQDAIGEYSKVLKLSPNDAEAIVRLADIEFKIKKYGEAIRLYEKIVKTSPRKAAIHANLGFAYGELKKYNQSSDHYEKSLKYGIKDPQIHYNLAYTYDKLGRAKDAIREYERYASSHPTMEILDILADHYVKEKQYDAAIRTYKRMLNVDARKKAAIYSSIAYVHGLKNETDRELEYYIMSTELEAEDDVVYLNMGAAYEKKGMYQEAHRAYSKAYEINPESVEAAKKIPEMKIRILQQKHRE
ncbi:MAG: tetratricopeptide repeat protein [Deltaproteobacteria bacterium]|nr:tetratricopeptide repeat protein [Deltaproteobacteria bacterium]